MDADGWMKQVPSSYLQVTAEKNKGDEEKNPKHGNSKAASVTCFIRKGERKRERKKEKEKENEREKEG